MTPGTRLASVLSHCLRQESFSLIVSPAIADLQFERGAMSHVTIVRSYIGIWQAFCAALWLDVAWNARTWVADDLRRSPPYSRVSEMSPSLVLASYVACACHIFFRHRHRGPASQSQRART